MPQVVAFCGRSGSGKTTVLTGLLTELSGRGWRVGVIKHASHHGFELDEEGKDSMKLREAGGNPAVVVSAQRVFVVEETPEEMDLLEVASRFLGRVDIVLAEGFKKSPVPKVEVLGQGGEPPLMKPEDRVIAVVGDAREGTIAPRFGPDETVKIADFIEARFLKNERRPGIVVRLDGRKLGMKGFVREFVKNGILGMLKSLRGFGDPDRITITIYPKRDER